MKNKVQPTFKTKQKKITKNKNKNSHFLTKTLVGIKINVFQAANSKNSYPNQMDFFLIKGIVALSEKKKKL